MAAVAASQFLTTIATAMVASVTAAASTPSSLTPAASQVPTNRADDEEPQQQTQPPATDACDAQLKIDEDKLAHCTDLPTDIDADKTTKKVKS